MSILGGIFQIFMGVLFILFHKRMGIYAVNFKKDKFGTEFPENAESISQYVYFTIGVISLLFGISHIINN